VQPLFSDGHSSGIYSWPYLYELGLHQEELWAGYLARLQEAGGSREPGDPRNSAIMAPEMPAHGRH
jgi:DUF971 family protein